MTETQPISPVVDQGAFLAALGVDAQTVVRNSLGVGFNEHGVPVVQYTVAMAVPAHLLGLAFLASSDTNLEGAEGQSIRVPQDRKRPTKKTAAKKAVPKKEEDSGG